MMKKSPIFYLISLHIIYFFDLITVIGLISEEGRFEFQCLSPVALVYIVLTLYSLNLCRRLKIIETGQMIKDFLGYYPILIFVTFGLYIVFLAVNLVASSSTIKLVALGFGFSNLLISFWACPMMMGTSCGNCYLVCVIDQLFVIAG